MPFPTVRRWKRRRIGGLDHCRLRASELFRCDVATAQKAVLVVLRGRRRRGASDGLYILGVLVVVAVPLVLLKPAQPSWLPVEVVRLAVLLEHLRR